MPAGARVCLHASKANIHTSVITQQTVVFMFLPSYAFLEKHLHVKQARIYPLKRAGEGRVGRVHYITGFGF